MTFTIHDKGLSTMIDWRNRTPTAGPSRPRTGPSSTGCGSAAPDPGLQRDGAEPGLRPLGTGPDGISPGLPRNVRETAAVVYRDAVDKNLIRGRSIEGVAAAALYAACRQCSVPRTLDEIAEVSRVSRKEIGRTYRFISRELG